MTSKSATATGQELRKVVLVIFDQAKMLDIVGPLQVFHDACLDDGNPAYQVTLASETGGPVTTDTGVDLASELADDAMAGTVDTLLIAGGVTAVSAAATAPISSCTTRCCSSIGAISNAPRFDDDGGPIRFESPHGTIML